MTLETSLIETTITSEERATLDAAGGAEFISRAVIEAVVTHMRATGCGLAEAMQAVKDALPEGPN